MTISQALQTRNLIAFSEDLRIKYPNRCKVCVACGTNFLVSLSKTISKAKYCSRPCSDKNMPKGYWNKGQAPSDITRERISNALSGSKSHLWRGGITKTNALIRTTWRFKKWRKEVFKRDDYRCLDCGAKSGETGHRVPLEAHHIKPFAYFSKLRFDVNNGQTLCKDCHKKTDTHSNKANELYGHKQSI